MFCEKWSKLGRNTDICERIRQVNYTEDSEHHYHRKCYKSLCHQTNLERAERKFEDDLQSIVQKKRGRPSHSQDSAIKIRKSFDQELCAFCQRDSNAEKFQVRTESMGKKLLQIKELSKDEDIRARLAFLSDPMDAFARNLKYQLSKERN